MIVSMTTCVAVLSAHDVIPLDANGLSDPYVVVSFCPEHCFPGVPTQTTKIVKKTLHPEFDESFELYVALAQVTIHCVKWDTQTICLSNH